MLMMRLQRVGRKNDPSYRIVVTDKRTGPKSNKHVDLLGSYNPKMNHLQIDAERAKDWISKGVQPSDTVHNMLVGQKIIEGKKINVLPRKSPIVSEEAEEEKKEDKSTDTEESAEEEVVEEEAEEVEESKDEVKGEAPAEAEAMADNPVEIKEEPAEKKEASEKEETKEAPKEEEKKDEV